MTVPTELAINRMTAGDIDGIVTTFEIWHKDHPQYERYLVEQELGERYVFVAKHGEVVVGYVTVVWKSGYAHFRESGIPEIVDLNVITRHQRKGVGTALIRACERLTAERGYSVVGIAVVMDDPDYAAARRLYPALGYVPDGRGVTPEDNELHMTKAIYASGRRVLG